MISVVDLPGKSLLDSLGHAVLLTDLHAVVQYLNPAAASLIGVEPEEVLGKQFMDFLIEDNRAQVSFAPEDTADRFEAQLRRTDGAVADIWLSIRPARDAAGRAVGLLISVTDITEKKLINRELEAMRSELTARVDARTQELLAVNLRLEQEVRDRRSAEVTARAASEHKSRFLSNMSHELRTPLNAIIGYTELILDVPEDTVADAEPDLRRVLSSGRQLLDMINEILDLARIESGTLDVQFERVDVGNLMHEVCEIMGVQADVEGVELICDVASADGNTDPKKLKQLLVGLLGHALRQPRVQRIEVRLTNAPLCVELQYDGRTVEPHQQQHLFDTFARAIPSTGGGTGLELSLARELARALGGELHYSCEQGLNVFRLQLGEQR